MPVAFERLAGWSDDRAGRWRLPALLRQAPAAGKGPMGPEPAFGSVDDWLTVCAAPDQPANADVGGERAPSRGLVPAL